MMKSLLSKIFAFSFILVLLLVCVQTLRPFMSEQSLSGATFNTSKPDISLASWLNGNFQRDFEQWFSENVGFRAFWVRTYNQINFSLFRQITSSAGTKVIIGKNNWLYTKEFIAAYTSPPPFSKTQAERHAEKIRRLQDKLEDHDITLLSVISPNKAAAYPEYLPGQFQQQSEEMAYDKTIPYLGKHGVRYLDSYKLFAEVKPDAPYELFPKGGIHWNNYGAFLVFRAMIEQLNPLLEQALPIPHYDSVELAPPRGADNDLVRLMNIWTPGVIEERCPYPNFTTEALLPEKQPKILIIGDSFSWHLADFFSEQQICTNVEVLFYYKRHVIYPHRQVQQFEAKKTDWNTFLLDKDIVIVELNQAFLHSGIGFGFVDDALQALSQ